MARTTEPPHSDTVGDLGEWGVIAIARAGVQPDGPPAPGEGIGDDCAVIPAAALGFSSGGSILVTTDSMVEGRHFRLDFSDPSDVGWKLLAVSVSDVAAMGGTPVCAVVTMQLPRTVTRTFVEGFYRGLNELATREGVRIVGGDTVEGNELALGLTLIGRTVHPPVLRSGARPGETVYVSGAIGSAGAGLALLSAGDTGTPAVSLHSAAIAPLLDRHRRPIPRRSLGELLSREGIAGGMIDVSDGLLHECMLLARESHVDIEIDLWQVPRLDATPGIRSLIESVTDGDDYELLFTAVRPAQEWCAEAAAADGLPAEIGRVRAASGATGAVFIRESPAGPSCTVGELLGAHGKAAGGFEHFRSDR